MTAGSHTTRRAHVRRAERRIEIIDAAIALLSERGPDVTVADIAAAAGTSEGTVFYAFTDRAELLAHCVGRLVADEDLAAAMAAAAALGSPRDRLLAAATALRGNMTSVVPVMLAVMRSPSLGPGPPLDGFTAIEQQLERVFGDAGDWAAPPSELAGELLGQLFAQVFRQLVGGRPLPALARTIDTFLSGALARR